MYTEVEHWVDKRIGEARSAQQPTVTDPVAIRMTDLVKGKLSEAPLTSKQLTKTAKALIADMVTPVEPEVQSNDEN